MKNKESVSFEEYVKAYSKYKAGKLEEEAFNKRRNAFIEEYGEIVNQYLCGDSKNVAILCQKKGTGIFSSIQTSFFTQYSLGNHPEIEKLLIEIDFLAAESARTLTGKSLGKCLGVIYKVAKNILGVLDSMYHKGVDCVADSPQINQTVEVIKNNLIQAKEYQQKTAKFSTQKNYLFGNIMGFAGLALIFLYTKFFNNVEISSLDNFSMSCLVYHGSIGGGIGAIISVMNRISSGSLNLNAEPDLRTTRVMGVLRPLIGGVFGILILLLFNSGFSVFTLSAENVTKIISNFIVLSFIAGFFERFVPELLDQTQNKILAKESGGSGAFPEGAPG